MSKYFVVPGGPCKTSWTTYRAPNCWDFPLLTAAGQAKSVRRPTATFTSHSQLFHKHENGARGKKFVKSLEKSSF
jgi:hypothetical protein